MTVSKITEKFIYNRAIKSKDAMPVWFCFPADYSIGMSSLGFTSLFKILDQNPDVTAERIFTDTEKTEFIPKNVKLTGFSFSFELDFLGIFKILDKFNIPLKSKDRNENTPLIFAGGPVATANPEPFAEFFDFFLIGDGEELFNEICDITNKMQNQSRLEKLKALSKLKGVYVPSFYEFNYNQDLTIKSVKTINECTPETVEKRITNPISNCLYTSIITSDTTFADMFLIELSRGCPMRCRFCIASYLTLPTRYPSYEEIIKAIEIGLQNSKKIGLLGALISLHPDFERICSYLIKKRKEQEFIVSISSLRADRLTPTVAKMLNMCGQKQITIAVEAGSESLRKKINKRLKEEEIINCIKIASENGIKGAKIYGMIGLPTESNDDINELINLMERLKKVKKGFKLHLSISSFVPKAQTPFERESRENNKTLKHKIELLRKGLIKINIDFKPTSSRWDYIQALISRADRRLSFIIEEVYHNGGNISDWNKAYNNIPKELKSHIPDFDWYALRNRENEEILPWDHIIGSVSKELLLKERLKAKEQGKIESLTL